jgi:hypothetical protein
VRPGCRPRLAERPATVSARGAAGLPPAPGPLGKPRQRGVRCGGARRNIDRHYPPPHPSLPLRLWLPGHQYETGFRNTSTDSRLSTAWSASHGSPRGCRTSRATPTSHWLCPPCGTHVNGFRLRGVLAAPSSLRSWRGQPTAVASWGPRYVRCRPESLCAGLDQIGKLGGPPILGSK